MSKRFINGCRNLNYYHPYESRSRKWKGNKYISLKNILRRTGNLFDTDCIITDECRYSWLSFEFLSKKTKDIYYAHIVTANHKLVDDIELEVINNMIKIEHENNVKEIKPTFEVSERDKFGKPKFYEMIDNPFKELKLECLGDLSESDYIDKFTDEKLAERPLIFEEYKIETKFDYAKLLHMTVNEKFITVDIINQHIQNFWNIGEVNWKAENPVSENELIYSRDWRKENNISLGVALKIEEELTRKLSNLI